MKKFIIGIVVVFFLAIMGTLVALGIHYINKKETEPPTTTYYVAYAVVTKSGIVPSTIVIDSAIPLTSTSTIALVQNQLLKALGSDAKDIIILSFDELKK